MIERRPISPSGAHGAAIERFELTLPANHFVDFGLRLAIEPISGIRKDSPAEKAGFRKGDRIVKVDGHDDFDPMRLPTSCFASAGKPMTFEVERDAGGGQRKTESLTVTPTTLRPGPSSPCRERARRRPGARALLPGRHPRRRGAARLARGQGRPQAGRRDQRARHAAVKPKRRRGFLAWIRQAVRLGQGERPKTFEFNEESPDWFAAFIVPSEPARQEVELIVNNASKPIKITPELDPDWYNPHARPSVLSA